MEEYTAAAVAMLIEEETYSSLEAMLREGVRRMLQAALEMEVALVHENVRGCVAPCLVCFRLFWLWDRTRA